MMQVFRPRRRHKQKHSLHLVNLTTGRTFCQIENSQKGRQIRSGADTTVAPPNAPLCGNCCSLWVRFQDREMQRSLQEDGRPKADGFDAERLVDL